jgi:ArsR family transcriptional regulator
LRQEQFGERSALFPLFGLLDRNWVVADLGAGTGSLALRIAPHVSRILAVDGSVEMLSVLRERTKDAPNVEARQGELESLPLESASVDIAFLVFALHYVVEPWTVLSESRRVLKPGGRLIVVDMREHEREEYRAEHGHVWLGFSTEQLELWTRRAGFERVDVTPIAPDPGARGPSLLLATFCKSA